LSEVFRGWIDDPGEFRVELKMEGGVVGFAALPKLYIDGAKGALKIS
jgi:hypothetical protein